jgi:hypothetical protein
MKATYRVPRPPEIAGNENFVNSQKSDELLGVIAFRAPDTSAAPAAKKRKVREFDAMETTGSRVDDDHRVYQSNSPFHTGWEEMELQVEAK